MEKLNDEWLCTIDTDNTQQGFAKCLQLILWLESITEYGKSDDFFANNEFLSFYISRANKMSIKSHSVLLKQEEYIMAGETPKFKKIRSFQQLIDGLQKGSQKNIFSYYIRVKMNQNESDITELQYLVLLLQTVPAVRNRVAIRLMSDTTSLWTINNYYRVSHFLRFIQKKYSCFYACENERLNSLRLLPTSTYGIQSTFLPLLEVDGQLCQVLNKTWLLETEYKNQTYDKLYQAVYPQNCDINNISWDLFQIAFRMLFRNLSGIKYNNKNSKKSLLDLICLLVEEVQGVSVLDMLLFGALVGSAKKNRLDYNEAKILLDNVQMLSLAIDQILENIVNHSERNQGVFTFRLQSNKKYMNIHYPKYELSEEEKCLELLIADSNRSDGIVQHFLNSNKADSMLKDRAQNVSLAHLFGDIREIEMKEIWRRSRSERTEMCHGLISFANGVRRLNGAIRVRSASRFENLDFKDIYYYNGSSENTDISELLPGLFVPGTQFSVVVNRPEADSKNLLEENEDWAFDFNRLVYATTYRELAQALAFDQTVRNLDISEMLNKLSINSYDQEEKDKVAVAWKEWFDSNIPDKEDGRYIYECNLQQLCQYILKKREVGEAFCKGFLSSHFFFDINNNVYYSILFQNPSAQFSHIFESTLRVVAQQEEFSIQNIGVYFYPKKYKGGATTLHGILKESMNEKIFPRVFPYTLFLRDEMGNTLFEKELIKQADTSICSENEQGFKISETHMRLGNKVHLDTFYEMALFFENPNYAYYTAFLFLRDFLRDKSELMEQKEKLLFYGYASYSRAIIWAIIQILTQYKELQGKNRFPNMEFIIYQNDLKIESEQSQVQMYYSKEEWQRDPHKIWEKDETILVLVVPISSSLTTFIKMKAELEYATQKEFNTEENFTAFWVRNNYKDLRFSTDEEKEFWRETDPANKTITSDIVDGDIHYLVFVTCGWNNPLECQKCFPADPIFEYPLVETDPTSTVPTQQFYKSHADQYVTDSANDGGNINSDEENDKRILKFKNNLIYGHISKGSNHYQYYIKIREYFQQEHKGIKSWLEKLREQDINDKYPVVIDSNSINILVIPQQVNNVEFGQYVYEYYFKGHAECIIINTEKEFRSNLQAEYGGLFSRLRVVKDPQKNIIFHYVDVAVNSGNSFNRVASLISSCLDLEEKYTFKIEQVFLLVSRLSEASKQCYVNDINRRFHTYVELKISSMRTFGDSCVPCKLQYEAKMYYKKAATKSISAYWEEKIYNRRCISFDKIQDYEKNHPEIQEEGYRRMICSHRAAHFIRPIQGAEISRYFSALRGFLDEIWHVNQKEHDEKQVVIYTEVKKENRKEWFASGLKIIARPFFSFDYRMRCVVMDFYLIISEYLIKGNDIINLKNRIEKNGEKQYLLQDGNLEWIINFANALMESVGSIKYQQLEFVRNNVLKGLADIKSNYILRKDTILSISRRIEDAYNPENNGNIEEFYEHYLRSILRLTHSSSDETKSVWLEYLLQYGDEYTPNSCKKGVVNGIDKLVSQAPNKLKSEFEKFLEILMVENNRPIYQAVIELDKVIHSEKLEDMKEAAYRLLKEYHMKNANEFLSFQCDNNSLKVVQLCALQDLLNHLNEKQQGMERYQDLGKKIQIIINKITDHVDEIILFGNAENQSIISEYLKLPNYFALFPVQIEDEIEREKSPEKQAFEDAWKEVQERSDLKHDLNKYGFCLLPKERKLDQFDVFIQLNNNYDKIKSLEEFHCQRIESIYIYIPCKVCHQQALNLTRMILMFRNKLIEWLENDFNNEAIPVLSQQKHLAKILSTDKMSDHNENDFVECQQKILMATTKEEYQKELSGGSWKYIVSDSGEAQEEYEFENYLGTRSPLDGCLLEAREWFLMRSYINSRIARLFQTMIRTGNELSKKQIIDTYIYYENRGQCEAMKPVKNLQVVFFVPTMVGYIRKNYLRQIMKTVTFKVEDVWDYKKKSTTEVEDRMENLSQQLKSFECINLDDNTNDRHYAYLSEYLAIILMDCFVSGIKAGSIWNQREWGGEAFKDLCKQKASEKCIIEIYREPGGECGGKAFDYLVIKNAIFHPMRSEKKGPGMSQAAIKWYIEGLWRSFFGTEENCPKIITEEKKDEYIIKLPILESTGGSIHE